MAQLNRKSARQSPDSDHARLPWPGLISGILVKRYKRFLVDVRLDNGRVVTAHCPNSGAMTGCSEPGRTVFLSLHDRPGRKLPYTLELIHMPSSLVGINTMVPNRLVHRALALKSIQALSGYGTITAEVKVGERSRLDFLLTQPGLPPCYVEVKNSTLVMDRIAYFPDAVTARGLKHIEEMSRLVAQGCRCVMFYLIQRMDADFFRPAGHIDPAYAQALGRAVAGGVEVLAYDVAMDLHGIRLNRRLPMQL